MVPPFFTRRFGYLALFAMMLAGALFSQNTRGEEADQVMSGNKLFARDNLVAWCIVPFDARQRGPEARAEMLARLGITKLAYDWRAEHIPTFDEEIETLDRWGIELSAFWFPGALNDEAQAILDALERHKVHTELWVSMHGGEIECSPDEQLQRVQAHVKALRPIVDAAARIGCKVGLYNHGGWFGEPENQIEILKALDADNVGIVYNLHHGHGHISRFPELLEKMKPYLYCLNLNGMTEKGEETGNKILPLGMGEHDLALLRTIVKSGYAGPIGVLGHTMDDAELTLRDNLDGLEWLAAQIDGTSAPGPRPPLRVGGAGDSRRVESLSPEFGRALSGGMLVDGAPAYRTPPLTVECRVRLHGKSQYNILVASDTKASGAHWEIFTEAGSGELSLYTPGLEPDHLRTGRDICDGEWHHVALQYAPDHVRLFVDGEPVAEHSVVSRELPVVPGGLAFGRLVEGTFGCEGEIDDVRISAGVRDIEVMQRPAIKDDAVLGLWDFDDLPEQAAANDFLEVEDEQRRAALPEFQVIPAARSDELSAGTDLPRDFHDTWQRSHGNEHNTRYSSLRQITRDNVSRLELAWMYRSGDGPENLQCNPIVVDGVMYAPTSGEHVVAVDGATGEERWRFKPGGKPAHRGLVYWPGDDAHEARLFFCAGKYLWALNPASGQPVPEFGDGGRVATGEVRVAGAIFENALILPTYERDVSAYDVRSGERLWTFHTIPQDGEFGRDTWNEPAQGANCWGGMALDGDRGIAYISTGSPKPNFAGNSHWGQNLFGNCVLALDARTGERLWHFQEIRHDIWDMDIPAPPNLVTVEHEGRRVDAVAQVTKLGNTLLLDRVTGKPLFPVRLRRAPVSRLPGERTWPYQPDIQLPEPFARQVFSMDDVTERTASARESVLSRVAKANMGWFEPFEEDKPTVLYGIHGGAEWTGAAYDPEKGYLYVSSNNIPWMITVFRPDEVARDPNAPPTRGEKVYQENCAKCHGVSRFGVGMNPPLHGLARRLEEQEIRELLAKGRNAMPAAPDTLTDADYDGLLDYLLLRDAPRGAGRQSRSASGRPQYTHSGYPKLLDDEGYPGCKPPWGTLNCLDLNTGKLVWQVPLGNYPDLAMWGEDDTGAENFGGPSLTAGGLVFCAGAADLKIRAFDAATGEVLWEHDLPFGGYAPPTVYEAGGREFVVIAATGGGKLGTETGDCYVAFALPE